MLGVIKRHWLTLLGIILGCIGGYIYYAIWGCANGCPIKSSAWKMTLYGALMGGLLLNIVQGEIEKRSKKS